MTFRVRKRGILSRKNTPIQGERRIPIFLLIGDVREIQSWFRSGPFLFLGQRRNFSIFLISYFFGTIVKEIEIVSQAEEGLVFEPPKRVIAVCCLFCKVAVFLAFFSREKIRFVSRLIWPFNPLRPWKMAGAKCLWFNNPCHFCFGLLKCSRAFLVNFLSFVSEWGKL